MSCLLARFACCLPSCALRASVFADAPVMADAAAANLSGQSIDLTRRMTHSHAVDRKIIRLVKERKLLYARNTLSVGNYHSKALQMWQEIAREMQWTVADVKRKWSHIRNSYSRHLRNEMNGARTIKGRMVTKWYLADDLQFLREHMATDLRPFSSSFSDSTTTTETYEIEEIQDNCETVSLVPTATSISWPYSTFAASHAIFGGKNSNDDDQADQTTSSVDSKPQVDDTSSYFTFFRGIHDDYLQLSGHGQRVFKQKCLLVLHGLLDEEEQRQSSTEVVIEEATSGFDDALIIKSECAEQAAAVESILGDMVAATVEVRAAPSLL